MGGSKRETAEKCPTSVPKCFLGLPGSLPEKCPKSVWKVSCAGVAQEKCPERKLRKRKKRKRKKKRVKTRNCRRKSKKCPKMLFGASWQPPRKMSKKCLESVLCWGCAGKMSGTKTKEEKTRRKEKMKKKKTEKKEKCQNEKLPKNVQKVSQNAFWGFLAASQNNVQKVSGMCPGAGVGAGKMSRNPC